MAEVTANGVRLHYQVLGSGERTVVFLHGLVMDNLSSWYFTAATRVARHCRVIVYDLRGHGRSERPQSGYRVEDMVDDLAGLLDELDIDGPVGLIGNSFGGLLALTFAARHPDRVERIALVDAHVSAAGWGEEMAQTLSLEGEERDRMIAVSFRNWLGRHSERKRNRLAENARQLVYETSLVDDLRGSTPLSDEELASIDCPVLALYGTDSNVLEQGRLLSGRTPRCELQELPDCTHSVLWEATDHVVARLVTFTAPRRYLFVVPPLTGHINPTVPIARELESRGHTVAWAAHPRAASELLAGEATILPLDDELPGNLQQEFSERADRMRGPARLKFLFEEFFLPLARAMYPQVDAVVTDWRPDVIIADQQALAGGLVARARKLPWASVSTTSVTVIDPFEGLPKVKKWLDDLLADLQREAGLQALDQAGLSHSLAIVLSTTDLVGKQHHFENHIRFVGPTLGDRPQVEFPWQWLDPAKKKVLVSLGTVNAAVGQRFFSALRKGLKSFDAQFIVVAPQGMIESPPENFLVRDYVPQLALMPQMDAVVCHAGHNTVAEALAHGRPLVLAPIKDDQPLVAQQVVEAGAGLRIKFGRARAEDIAEAVAAVLSGPEFGEAAQSIGASFRAAGGVVKAADLLEMVI